MNRLSGIGPASVIARARRSGRLPSDAISLTVPPRKRGPRNTGRHARNSGPPLSRENDPVSRDALVPGDGDDALAAAGAGGDQVDAAEDHRDAQHLPHVDRGREDGVGELRIGLAEEFDEEARAAIADEEDAGELARIVARLRPPEEEPEHRQQDEPFEPGFVKMAGVARDDVAGARDADHTSGGARIAP